MIIEPKSSYQYFQCVCNVMCFSARVNKTVITTLDNGAKSNCKESLWDDVCDIFAGNDVAKLMVLVQAQVLLQHIKDYKFVTIPQKN